MHRVYSYLIMVKLRRSSNTTAANNARKPYDKILDQSSLLTATEAGCETESSSESRSLRQISMRLK